MKGLNNQEIIKAVHRDYQDVLDFKINRKNIQRTILQYDISAILLSFVFWIVPVITVYILGFSIGWVIRGFRKKNIDHGRNKTFKN